MLHLLGNEYLCVERLAGPIVQARAIGSSRDRQGVESVVYRQTMLLSPGDFVGIFDKLESFVGDITKPGGSLVRESETTV